MEKEICNILCIEKDQEKDGLIELIEKEDSVEIKFYFEKLSLEKEGDNYFETLIKLREELEKRILSYYAKVVVKMFIHLECYLIWEQEERHIH